MCIIFFGKKLFERSRRELFGVCVSLRGNPHLLVCVWKRLAREESIFGEGVWNEKEERKKEFGHHRLFNILKMIKLCLCMCALLLLLHSCVCLYVFASFCVLSHHSHVSPDICFVVGRGWWFSEWKQCTRTQNWGENSSYIIFVLCTRRPFVCICLFTDNCRHSLYIFLYSTHMTLHWICISTSFSTSEKRAEENKQEKRGRDVRRIIHPQPQV